MKKKINSSYIFETDFDTAFGATPWLSQKQSIKVRLEIDYTKKTYTVLPNDNGESFTFKNNQREKSEMNIKLLELISEAVNFAKEELSFGKEFEND